MKAIKFLALMLVALVGMTACNDDDNDGDGNNSPKPINTEYKGYIFVSSNYFHDMYYGNNATLKIYQAEENQYNVEFHDPQWGDVTFENVTLRPELKGEGTLSMNYRGKDGSYDAELSGTIMMPIIKMPSVMGGTTITFYAGEAPLACQLEGKHNGANSVMVGDSYGPYDMNATYSISANPDGTLNLTIPEYSIEGTPIGDLTVGKSVISNIAFDTKKNAFYRVYGEDGLSIHVKAVNDGTPRFDADYAFAQDSYVLIEQTEAGIKVTNSFQPGRMPFPIKATFTEVIAGEK